MENGRVKWFDEGKGLGFIEPLGGGPDIFVHYSNILMDGYKVLNQGDLVAFELLEGPRGLLALNVRLTWRDALPRPRWDYHRKAAGRRWYFPDLASVDATGEDEPHRHPSPA